MTIETLLDEIETEANRVIMVDDYDLSAKRIASHELTIFILNKVSALRAALQSVKVEAKPLSEQGCVYCNPIKSMPSLSDILQKRRDDLREWIKENASHCLSEQRHLDEGSSERAYWHYGYMMAMRDVLAQIGSTSTPKH